MPISVDPVPVAAGTSRRTTHYVTLVPSGETLQTYLICYDDGAAETQASSEMKELTHPTVSDND